MADGVVHTLGPLPPVPPGPIASRLKALVHETLNDLPAGAGGAKVEVSLQSGVNVVFAHKGENGKWQVDAWVGKTWKAEDPWQIGASGTVLWGR